MASESLLADASTRAEVQKLRDEFVSLNAERMRYMQAFERTKQTNESTLMTLREENKELKEQVAHMKSDVYTAHSIALSEAERDRLTAEVTLWRGKRDSLSHDVQQMSDSYSKLREQLMALHRQRSTAIDTPEMRTVRALENRLDKAMLKFNEAQSIRKTYEQIVKRLREERMGFDQQLSALETTVGAKRKDLTELRGLATEAEKAKTAAIEGMKKVALQQKTEAEKRVRALRAKEEAALKQARANRTQRRRSASRRGKQDMTAAEEEALRQEVVANLAAIDEMVSKEAASLSKVHLYEEAFRAIQEVTGVRDENEVIQRMATQREQITHLQGLSKENAGQITSLSAEISAQRERVEHVKFGGGGSRVGGKQALDELELQVTEAEARKAKASGKYAHLADVLRNLKAGIEHLAESLAPVVAELHVELPAEATRYRARSKRSKRAPAVGVEEDGGMLDTLAGVEQATIHVMRHIDSLRTQLQAGVIDPAGLTGAGSHSSAGVGAAASTGSAGVGAATSAGAAASAAPQHRLPAAPDRKREAKLDGTVDEFLATTLTEGDIDDMNGRALNVWVQPALGKGAAALPAAALPSSDDSDSDADDGADIVSREMLKKQAHRSAAVALRRK